MPPTAAILNQPSVITRRQQTLSPGPRSATRRQTCRFGPYDGRSACWPFKPRQTQPPGVRFHRRFHFRQPAAVSRPQEDFSKYPRPLEADLAKLAEVGVPFVFNPSAAEMYPSDFVTHVEVTGVSEPWEGAIRPGHFAASPRLSLSYSRSHPPIAPTLAAKTISKRSSSAAWFPI